MCYLKGAFNFYESPLLSKLDSVFHFYNKILLLQLKKLR
ncbi:hypothetical protein D1BOALGB6SA_8849 [Olavius sp. associated proteobacterium Delta 1]|nr:hypothetical protein D1BOALGB6SA_8849 [Olavius sp. associated proteobacterium Delta 1]